MKKLSTLIICSFLLSFANAQDVIQLPIPKSGKVTLRYMFRNGSICDPAGKEGLTSLTSDMIIESGTQTLNSTAIRKMIYPWAASMSSSTDKEVSVFTFEVPTKYQIGRASCRERVCQYV